MAFIYTTTDSTEAQKILNPNNTMDIKYHDLDISTGENIARRIGFNPMCSIRFDEDTPLDTLDGIALALMEKGLFVNIDTKNLSRTYIPSDIQARNELIKHAMSKKNEHSSAGIEPGYCLLIYSNDPCEIRDI